MRTVGQILPAVDVLPQLVILAGKLYADALLHGAHWHNLPRPEEPLRGIAGFGPRVKWLKSNMPVAMTVEKGPEQAPHARGMTIDDVRIKISHLPRQDRCHHECLTWVVSETNHGV